MNVPAESAIMHRYMTWTDLLYMALTDITKNKHLLVTWYPLSDSFGIFITNINIASTKKTVPMNINGTIYKWYPDIDLSLSRDKISNNFVDSMRFSNSYLKGINGDYITNMVS